MHTYPTCADVLPAPFTWVDIPAATVTLKHSGGYINGPVDVQVGAFAMSQYPITYGQFAVFAEADDGYQNRGWWDFSEAATLWRHENARPRHVDYGGEDHPRTHITWYEAVAFCRWLSVKADAPIRLPTEAEWQRAAQGDDARPYPWGHEWDADRCAHNLRHDQIGTSAVTTYAGAGDSPYGVADMIGNVWEWCATNWDTGSAAFDGEDARVLRGGSWFDDVMGFFVTSYRSSWMPDLTSDLRGFRIVTAKA